MSNPLNQVTLEPERYEIFAGATHHFDLARRDFFKLLGAGIAVLRRSKQCRRGARNSVTIPRLPWRRAPQ